MTRYFMRDTPLCQMEQQMMTPPYFKPRGHGRYYPGFQYSRDDMECPYCMNFRRNHPCPLEQCVCLDERIVAGAIDLNEFVRDCFFPEAGVQLQARLERSFNGCSIGFFLRDSHRERWQHWRARCYRMSGRNLAALFLLTAYEDIWRRMIWKFDARGLTSSPSSFPASSRNCTVFTRQPKPSPPAATILLLPISHPPNWSQMRRST